MAGNHDGERVTVDRLAYRVRRSGGAEPPGDLAERHDFATGNAAREGVNPAVERGDVPQIEGDIGEIGRLPAQQRDNALDDGLDLGRRAQFARVRVLPQHAPPGFDLPGLRQVNAN